MCSTILLACPVLLAAALSQEEPNACLLQQGSSPVQRAVLLQDTRQHPSEHADHEASKGEESGHEDNKEKPQKHEKEEESTHVEKSEKHGEKKEKKKQKWSHKEAEKHKRQHGVEDEDLTSVRLELRLYVGVSDLKGTEGSLPVFLDRLEKVLVKAAGIPKDRLDVLGIRGEYTDEGVFLEEVKSSLSDSPKLAKRTDLGRSTIDLEVLPGADSSQPSPRAVYALWKDQLKRKDGPLMGGPLKGIFKGAKLAEKHGVEGLAPHHAQESGSYNAWRPLPLILLFLCSPLLL